MTRVFLRPAHALELVLADDRRLVRTIALGRHRVSTLVALTFVTVLFTIPFGLVLEFERAWRILALFLGSLAICLPSLQVFGAYSGVRVNADQSLALGLVLTSVAALFSFAFAPIQWFLTATMAEHARILPSHLAVLFLAISLLAGLVHLLRCLARFDEAGGGYVLLVLAWQVLFTFITFRMARLLELVGA